jgi:hypothetical protein
MNEGLYEENHCWQPVLHRKVWTSALKENTVLHNLKLLTILPKDQVRLINANTLAEIEAVGRMRGRN